MCEDHTAQEFQQVLGFRRSGAWWNATRRAPGAGAMAEAVDWAKQTHTGKRLGKRSQMMLNRVLSNRVCY